MLFWFRRIVYLAVALATVWSASVFGLPWARAVLHGLCARSGLARGVCSPGAQQWLARLDQWQRDVLQPLSHDERVRQAAAEAQRALQTVEAAVRERVGPERTAAAIRGADIALTRLERLTSGGVTDAREKLSALPGNARSLLARLRAAFDRLRAVVSATGQRAEDVARAVEDTRRALDAVVRIVPMGGHATGNLPASP
jgi:hypothetical protein